MNDLNQMCCHECPNCPNKDNTDNSSMNKDSADTGSTVKGSGDNTCSNCPNRCDENDYASVFDRLYTTNHIQMLKALIPFMDGGARYLPVIIKYLELKHTLYIISEQNKSVLSYAQKSSPKIHASQKSSLSTDPSENIEKIYNAIHKYLSYDEEKQFSQMLSMLKTVKNIQDMMEMAELFKSLNPEADTGNGMDMLSRLGMGGLDLGGLNIDELIKMLGNN